MKEALQVIGSLTGLIGTAGGLLLSYLTLRHTYWKDRHSIRLEIAEAFIVTPKPGSTKAQSSEDMLTFKVVNTGTKDYTVVSVGLRLGRRSGGLYINQPSGTVTVPHILKPDETCNFWTEYEALKKDIKKPRFHSRLKIRGYVSDYMGNTFNSKPHTIVFKETRWHRLKQWVRKKWNSVLAILWP